MWQSGVAVAGRSNGLVEMKKGGLAEQIRGMKTRSSVKKLCEGCKVRLLKIFLFV